MMVYIAESGSVYAKPFKPDYAMSTFANQPSSFSAYRVTIGLVKRSPDAIQFVTLAAFERMFACAINSLPQNVCVMGWVKSEQRWYCAPESLAVHRAVHLSNTFHTFGTKKLLAFLAARVFPSMEMDAIWFPYCFYDAWRERTAYASSYCWVEPPDMSTWMEWRGAPGALPILSPNRHWLVSQGAQLGDPSAFMVPDGHYLLQNHYAELFAMVAQSRVAWTDKLPRAILAASDHGESSNFLVPRAEPGIHPRRLLRDVVAAENLDVDVFLGANISLPEQLRYRYIVDVDGFARTWSAWAWKMMSGSTVLSLASIWTSFFNEQFLPWEHFVPIANDSSDLAEKLQWCREHDSECQAIAERAQKRAMEVYNLETVTGRVADGLRAQLTTPPPADWLAAVATIRSAPRAS